ATLSVAPQAGDTTWTVNSSWPHRSFGGDFLPAQRIVGKEWDSSAKKMVGVDGFSATYRVGNLALGRSLVSTGEAGATANPPPPSTDPDAALVATSDGRAAQTAQISLIQPVDLYSQVNRAVKYGFLFIGFTFLALLMFDVIGGVAVSAVE